MKTSVARSRTTAHRSPSETAAGWLWISPWLVGFLAFMLAPMAMSFYYSLTDYPLLEAPIWIGLDNYAELFRDGVFLDALWRTLIYGLIFVPLATILALVLAAMLNHARWGEGALQAALFTPTLVPLAASAMVWMWLLNGQYGFVNRALAWIGLAGPNWLTDREWALPTLVIIGLWGIGQSVVVYAAAIKQVPRTLYEAASLDGMAPARQFWHITVPMLSPMILFNAISLTIGALQIFTIPFIITKATPGNDPRSMYFYTTYLYDNGFVYGRMGYASAMAWLQLIVTLLLTGLTFLVSRRAVYYRGV